MNNTKFNRNVLRNFPKADKAEVIKLIKSLQTNLHKGYPSSQF